MHTALGSLEIEDLLVGPRCPKNRFLASSVAGVESVGEDVFFDADDQVAGGLSPRSSLGSPSMRGEAPPGAGVCCRLCQCAPVRLLLLCCDWY